MATARKPLTAHQRRIIEKCHLLTTGGVICVYPAKYGFIGKLYPSLGNLKKWLPVPTGKARTAKTAMKNARAFIAKVKR